MQTQGWRPGIRFLLAASHALAGLAAVGSYGWARASQYPPAESVFLAAAVALTLGMLLTFTLQQGLKLVDLMLERLIQGLPVAEPSLFRRWPLVGIENAILNLGKRLEHSLQRERDLDEQRRQLIDQVSQTAVQEERNRLARDLHDSIKQQIFSVSVSLAAAQARWGRDPGGAQADVANARQSAQEAQVEMRALLQQLRPAPLDSVGLLGALADQCQALGYRTGARIATTFGELPANERLPAGVQEMLFRIAQEGLANIGRHARATQVDLQLEERGAALIFELRDNGLGFDPATKQAGMGLANIQERAATIGAKLQVESAPGAGTRITVRVPLIESPLPHTGHASQSADDQLQHWQELAISAHWRTSLAVLVPLGMVVLLSLSSSITFLTGDYLDVLFTNPLPELFQSIVGVVSPFSLLMLSVTLGQIQYYSVRVRASAGEHSPALSDIKRAGLLNRATLCACAAALLSYIAYMGGDGTIGAPVAVVAVLVGPGAIELVRYYRLTETRMRQRAAASHQHEFIQSMLWMLGVTMNLFIAIIPLTLTLIRHSDWLIRLAWPLSLIGFILATIMLPLWLQIIRWQRMQKHHARIDYE